MDKAMMTPKPAEPLLERKDKEEVPVVAAPPASKEPERKAPIVAVTRWDIIFNVTQCP